MAPWCTASSGLGWVGLIGGWAVLMGVVVWAVCRLFPGQAAPDPRTVLEQRFAAGELDAGQYRTLRDALDGRSTTTST